MGIYQWFRDYLWEQDIENFQWFRLSGGAECRIKRENVFENLNREIYNNQQVSLLHNAVEILEPFLTLTLFYT